MKKLVLIFVLLVGFYSCTSKNYDKPKNLISKSEMIDIMTDLYISQQGLSMFPTQNEDQNLNFAKDAVDIMKAYDITFHTFEESYKYYAMNPEKFKKMLDEVKVKLEDQYSKEEKERQKNQTNNLEDIKKE